MAAAAAAATATMTTTTTTTTTSAGNVLVKKPVITRLDSGHGDRKIRSSPPEDNTGDDKGMQKGRGEEERRHGAVVVDVATPFFASLSAN